jgi:hypothetical protein
VPFKHPPELRAAAVDLVRSGVRPVDAAARLGVSGGAVYQWLGVSAPDLVSRPPPCFRCWGIPTSPPDPQAYTYLLGLYLGDGCLRRHANATYDLTISAKSPVVVYGLDGRRVIRVGL